jgi:hypothetical protein
MTLSCDCDVDFDPSDVAWYWMGHSAWKPMPVFERRKRCVSCNKFINIGEDVFEYPRKRATRCDLEERLYDEEGVPLASYWACEICSGLLMAVEDLGFCYTLGDNIKDSIAEYRKAEREAEQANKKKGVPGYFTADEFL